jgi:hypothetical protein
LELNQVPKNGGAGQRSATGKLSCVVYARVSSKDQEREGFSIPAQLELLHAYGAANALSIAKEFIDIETPRLPVGPASAR